ncbi:hypothetical protein [Tatumella citrea]|uniref:hypothetical protein n=1 Tax=Tatumella citrea TaxID=53336 RepID=UPI0012FCE08D|nr:hypothetical protein [Tatumella citrea]
MNAFIQKKSDKKIDVRHPRGSKIIEELLNGIDLDEIKESNEKMKDYLNQKPVGNELL